MVTDKRNPQPKPCSTDGTRQKSRSLTDPRKTGGASPASLIVGFGIPGECSQVPLEEAGANSVEPEEEGKSVIQASSGFQSTCS